MMTSLSSEAHNSGQLNYHLEWCTKYRFKMLAKQAFFEACEKVLRDVGQRWGISFLELSVMSDHVHAVVSVKPTMTISKALNLLKGASSHALFDLEPKFRLRYTQSHFWSRGSFYCSVGDADLEMVRRYVREDNDPRQQILS